MPEEFSEKVSQGAACPSATRSEPYNHPDLSWQASANKHRHHHWEGNSGEKQSPPWKAFLKMYFIYLLDMPYCMWDLSSPTRDGTCPPLHWQQSPNHWTTREGCFSPLEGFKSRNFISSLRATDNTPRSCIFGLFCRHLKPLSSGRS